MRDTHERPVCHRADDLVAYLYGEASEADALDFGRHLQQCDACRREFAGFDQVHESIQLWRNETLGASFNPVAIAEPAIEAKQFVRHDRKLSALAALREFFTVSPLWLRGATAFAALLLLALGVMFVRTPKQPVEVVKTGAEKLYSQQELEAHIKEAVEKTRTDLTAQKNSNSQIAVNDTVTQKSTKRIQVAVNPARAVRPRGLNRQEREQLAADLRLSLPTDEDDLLLLPDQGNPNR